MEKTFIRNSIVPDFYAHEAELEWLTGGFPQPLETIKECVVDRCNLPDGYDVNTYDLFQGIPAKILYGNECTDIGGRRIDVLHTPGHAPGHMCFWGKEKGYLYTGELVNKDTLTAWFPSTDPNAYLQSLEKIAKLHAKRIFPAHHSLAIQPEIVIRMRDAFRKLKTGGQLHHGSGTFSYGDWSI